MALGLASLWIDARFVIVLVIVLVIAIVFVVAVVVVVFVIVFLNLPPLLPGVSLYLARVRKPPDGGDSQQPRVLAKPNPG